LGKEYKGWTLRGPSGLAKLPAPASFCAVRYNAQKTKLCYGVENVYWFIDAFQRRAGSAPGRILFMGFVETRDSKAFGYSLVHALTDATNS
jgi:hypothetical protein